MTDLSLERTKNKGHHMNRAGQVHRLKDDIVQYDVYDVIRSAPR